MKSTSSPCTSAIRPPSSMQPLRGVSCLRNGEGRIGKLTQAVGSRIGIPAIAEPEMEVEMLACLARLEELVPNVSRQQNAATHDSQQQTSQVQLLQHVIDYILDLESTLDFRPADSTVVTTAISELPLSFNRCSRASSCDGDASTTSEDDTDSRPSLRTQATTPTSAFCGASQRPSALSMLPSSERHATDSSNFIRSVRETANIFALNWYIRSCYYCTVKRFYRW